MIEKLEKGNRGRAMKKLRVPPLGEPESLWVTFRAGLLMGIIAMCVIVGCVACKL